MSVSHAGCLFFGDKIGNRSNIEITFAPFASRETRKIRALLRILIIPLLKLDNSKKKNAKRQEHCN